MKVSLSLALALALLSLEGLSQVYAQGDSLNLAELANSTGFTVFVAAANASGLISTLSNNETTLSKFVRAK
jgi:hydrogenase/urease accessory protein HupE